MFWFTMLTIKKEAQITSDPLRFASVRPPAVQLQSAQAQRNSASTQLAFCSVDRVFCFEQHNKQRTKTLCRNYVIRNLTNFTSKPNFRFNNNNWQLWQTNNQNNLTFMEPFDEHADENVSEETAYDSYYTQYTAPDSMDCGSDNLLVTFDYGYSDSIGATEVAGAEPEEVKSRAGAEAEAGNDADYDLWFGTPQNDAWAFKVHHVQHKDESLQSLISYDVDDQSVEESEISEQDNEEVFYDSIEG